mgnify:CR=1 FL=1
MIIGYDAKRIVRNRTGLGAYGRTLVNDLAAAAPRDTELLLYAPDSGHDDLRLQVAERSNLHFVYPPTTHLSPLPSLHKAYWRSHGIVSQLLHDGVQLFHGLSGELPIGLCRAGIPGVVTIHDLIFLRHPEYYHWLDTKVYAWKFRATCREATRIVAISECTKRDIVELGGVSPDRIDVVYQSCNPRFGQPLDTDSVAQVRQQRQLPRRFVLSVGTIEERKNTLLLVKALPMLPDDIHLVLVGRHTAYADAVTAYAEAHRLDHRLHLLHGVSDHDLHALYQMAEVFAYPSRYEGFGIPVIEAVFSQLPVVACTGSCLEEAGGPHCLYVGPDDAEGMAHAISQLLRGASGREQRIEQSMHYVERFRGRDVAAQMLDIYASTLNLDSSFATSTYRR